MICRIAAIMLLGLLAGAAQADSKFYYGLSLNSAELDTEAGFSLETNGLGFKFGREFGRWLAVELHGGASSDGTDNLLRDPEITFGGAFLRLNIPFERVNLYVLGGVSRFSVDTGTVNISEEEPAGGVGMDLLASPDAALTLEVIRYGADNREGADNSVDTVNLGFTYRFDFPGLR